MKRGKKFTAALLCIMMMLTMMPAMAFADDPLDEAIPANITNPSQATNNNVVLQKSLEKANDGTYTITMESYATGRVTVAKNQSTDFVIVLDQSGSMDDYITVGRGSSDLNALDKELGATAGFYVGMMDGIFSHEREIRYNATTGTWQYWKLFKTGFLDIPYYDPHWEDIGSNKYNLDEIGIKKIDAAKVAVKNFIDATAADNTENGNTHRIAAVGFSSTGEDTHGQNFTTGFELADTSGLRNKVINQFDTDGGTYTDEGMQFAKNILDAAKADTNYQYAERGHVVIVLTDGEPGDNGFDSKYANKALAVAKDIKADYDATDETKNGCAAKVYTIGLKLNAASGSNVDKFMNYLSSNYPTASDMNTPGAANTDGIDYYYLVNDAEGLNNIFKGIAEQEGGISTTVTLGTGAVLTDTVNSDVFDITGVSAGNVSAYTVNAVSGAKVADIDSNNITVSSGTVSVKGFDYTDEDNVVILDAQDNPTQGKKLIVKISGLTLSDNNLANGIVDEEDNTIIRPAVFESNDGYAAVKATADGEAIVESLSPVITGVPVTIDYYYRDNNTADYAKTASDTVTKYSIPGSAITSQYAFNTFGETKTDYTLDKVVLADNTITADTVENDATFVLVEIGLTIGVYYTSSTPDPTEYTVTYQQPTGATGTDVRDTVTVTSYTLKDFNAVSALATTAWVVPTDKEFDCWVLSTDDIATYAAGASYTLTGNVTFIAKYKDKTVPPTTTVTVTYKQPTGVTGTDVVKGNEQKGNYTLLARTATDFTGWDTPDGKEFKGWKVEGTDDTALIISSYDLQADTTFVAVYGDATPQDPQYTAVVNYYQYGGGFGSDYKGGRVRDNAPDVTTADNGDVTVKLLSFSDVTGKAAADESTVDWTKPSKMKFNGWKYLEEDQMPVDPRAISTTDLYNGSITISADDMKELAPNGQFELNFMANYKKSSSAVYYTLNFETNGGSQIDSITRVSGSIIDLDEFVPTKKGYNFKGWYTDEKLTTKAETQLTLTQTMTVYAKWSEKSTNANGTPSDLNSKDHIKYVVGYPDGYVRPNNFVTRAETASMLYRLLTDERRAEVKTYSNNFTDVSATAWYVEPASSMYKGGYIAGYEDGTFGGDRNITRAEFVSMLVRFIGADEGVMNFTDVPQSHWAYKNIAIATSQGWTSGYSDGTFKPDQAITRAEAMSIINRVLNRGVNASSNISGFKAWPDNYSNAWYYYDVIEATNSHDYTGERPSENWSNVK